MQNNPLVPDEISFKKYLQIGNNDLATMGTPKIALLCYNLYIAMVSDRGIAIYFDPWQGLKVRSGIAIYFDPWQGLKEKYE